ncbi:MAG TPA: 3D domain-containing protein [Pyrinomonadaceae bacterium]|nr:3D domain-containing protein [Pyrinomonadaceae bacterium]
MKVISIFSSSAVICTALLSSSLILSARSSSAEPLTSQIQQSAKNGETVSVVIENTDKGNLGETTANEIADSSSVAPPASYVATAYSLRGRTASGRPVSKGLIAADPRVLPLGSRVKLEAGNYSGEYLVADTGGAVRGRRIDIWTPTSREAMRFGRRVIKLTVLSWGGKRKSVVANKAR